MKKNHQWVGRYFFKVPLMKILLIMKLIVVLICFSGLLSSMGETYAQSTKLTLNLENVAVKEVLQKIESQTEFSFMYDNNKIDVERKVDVVAQEKTIDVILAQLFLNHNVNYEIIDRHIVLVPSGSPLVVGQQERKITGKVTDQSGVSLPGVTLVLKGTNNGTVSDGNGNFELSGVPEKSILIVSFVGMKTQEIDLGTQTNITVVMEVETFEMGDVVVTALGISKNAFAIMMLSVLMGAKVGFSE